MWELLACIVCVGFAGLVIKARFELLEYRLKVSEQETTRLLQLFEDCQLANHHEQIQQLVRAHGQLKDRLLACISEHTSRFEELADLGHSLGKQITALSKHHGRYTNYQPYASDPSRLPNGNYSFQSGPPLVTELFNSGPSGTQPGHHAGEGASKSGAAAGVPREDRPPTQRP